VTPTNENPERLFLENIPLIEDVVQYICRRYNVRGEEAADLASEIKLKLMSDDYAVLRKFEGRSSLKTFLVTVVACHYRDRCNKLWGKWRPSAEARRLGETAIRLEELLYRDSLPFDQAVRILRDNERRGLSERELADMAERLPPRWMRTFLGEESLESMADGADRPERNVANREALAERDKIGAVLRSAIEGLAEEEQVILKLRFFEGMKVAAIARALRLDQKKLYRRIDQLLEGLRAEMTANGVDEEKVKVALESVEN